MKDLTFVIPIRHPDNLRDRDVQVKILQKTFKSYTAQTCDSWRAVIVANPGTPLPDLPEGFDVAWVDYGPNPQHELKQHNFQEALHFFLFDKGRRVWSGIKAFPDSRYFMVMDDDDLVSRDLTKYVRDNSGPNGWFLNKGYGIDPNGAFAMSIDRFHKTSGSSHIVRADLYPLPDKDDESFRKYVMVWLGAHGGITELFEAIGKPLEPLPFYGAVYMVNNPNSHSNSNSMLRQYVLNKNSLLRPWTLPGKIAKLRRVNTKFKEEFLGGA